MKTYYILIDYENVQPTDLARLRDGPFKVRVFLGPNQSKIPVTLAAALQALGNDAEYLLLESAGANALDFHIAYYLGRLSTEDPAAYFHVISKDTGFDPLIRHLKTRGVFAQRSTSIAEMPCFRSALPSAVDAQIEAVVAHLARLKAAKPRAQKTLLSTMNTLFRKELTEQQLADLLATLCARGIVKVDGTRVSYELAVDT